MAIQRTSNRVPRGEHQREVAVSFLVSCWFFLALRMWTRTRLIANFGWDDATMILATMMFTVYCASMLFLDAHGGGTHVPTTDLAQTALLTKWTVVGESTYIATVMILKISLGIFFARIVVKPAQLWTVYVTMFISTISSVACLFFALFRCGADLDRYLEKQLASQCTPRDLDLFFSYSQASFTTLTDCIFAALPIFIVWNSNMDIQSKVSVALILSLAALGCICSVLRFQYINGLTHFDDFFWNATNIAIWSTIEPGMGIIAGCLATLRPCLRQLIRLWAEQGARGSSDPSQSNTAR